MWGVGERGCNRGAEAREATASAGWRGGRRRAWGGGEEGGDHGAEARDGECEAEASGKREVEAITSQPRSVPEMMSTRGD